MSNDLLSRLDSQIARKKAELAELETTARVLRQMMGITDTVGVGKNEAVQELVSVGNQHDLVDATILESSLVILREKKGQPMHYREITEQAISRGYSSGRKTARKNLERSFWDTLRRRSGDSVRFVGKGKFVLSE